MNYKTAIEIRDAIKSGETTATAVVKYYLDKIKAEDGKVGAFLETFDEEALARAEEIDALVKAGAERGRLAGVPIAVKDNILIKGHTASAGSKILADYTAVYDATVITRLREAGAIFIGRTNMDEFGMGSSTETSAYQKTHNPWNLDKIPGGSSGGSVAAVAAGFVPVALGSDTGGSIRQPASLCGVVGMKPTYGRVSRYGLIALASSLDQIGPLCHTAEDAALVLEIMAGKDANDMTTLENSEVAISELLKKDVKGLKIGVPKEFFETGIDPEIEKVVRKAIDVLVEGGAEVIDISLPLTEYALPAYYIIQPGEAASNLARFDGMRYGTRAEGGLQESYKTARGEGFGMEVKRRIMIGNYILSAGYADAYYKKALAVRTAIHTDLAEALKSVDVIIGPTSPSVAWNINEKFNDPVAMYLSDIYTTSANIAGIPSISVPCGFVNDLPVGLQIMAGIGEDYKVIDVASAYQDATDWNTFADNKNEAK